MNYRRICCLAAVCLLLMAFVSARGEGAAAPDTGDMISRIIQVPGRGEMRYYAQNDPLWGGMIHRFPHQSNEPRFSGTGCIPTAVAMGIVNLIPREQLSLLNNYTWKQGGFRICSCSMNRFGCYLPHERYQLRTTEDFERFFCLAVGSYFSGNNTSQAYACGSFYLVPDILKKYGLRYVETSDLNKAASLVEKEGALAIALVAGEDCPFTTGSHALLLASVEEGECYFLDSFCRRQDEYYRRGPTGMIRVIEPGLVAMERKWAARLGAYQIFVVFPPESSAARP